MQLEYAVTLEFPEAAPETVRGVCTATKATTVARRAVAAAFKTHPGRKWSSLVILLQRPDPAPRQR
jgi:hypothetical protein